MQQFSVGIDLGTTNCVVAYTRLDADEQSVQSRPVIHLLRIPQATAPNQTESPESLPSFLYLPTEAEMAEGAFAVDGIRSRATVNGLYARSISAEKPERTVSAAKSWLCYGGVDRHAPILPWGMGEDLPQLSPVEATKLLLQHLVDAWQAEFPDAPLAEQLVTLTVPASFDMAARELTREAAFAAGLPHEFILLEEPQAAVYHWLEKTGDAWRKAVKENDSLLVCDVGGGTTDLTLVRVEQDSGELVLRRLAVGNHLLVGGDNMDLALAHFVAGKFAEKGTKLNPWQSISLWHACRRAKESLLDVNGKDSETISVLGRGSKLIGGTVSVEVSRQEVQQLLIDGFLPIVDSDAQPNREPHSGFQELGLQFEADTAITRHVAAFLTANEIPHNSNMHLLLNGGVFKSPALRQRVCDAMAQLGSGSPLGRDDQAGTPQASAEPKLLGGPEDLDHAVARGAAFYGWSKQHGGLRIRGGTARSYYVGIESAGLAIPGMPRPLQALCVVPFGMEEGSELDVPGREVGLVVGRSAQFRFFAAANRKSDTVGQTLRAWDEDELVETAPMELTLDPSSDITDEGFVPVRFHSRISELGVFELWCKSTRDDHKWKLEFSVREEAGAADA